MVYVFKSKLRGSTIEINDFPMLLKLLHDRGYEIDGYVINKLLTNGYFSGIVLANSSIDYINIYELKQ